MKAVMLSVRPKWCELIANGKKTVEVRKSRPKLETPFKCYIYETFGKMHWADIPIPKDQGGGDIRDKIRDGGKVIGEFVCDDVFTILNGGNSFLVEGMDVAGTNKIARGSCLDYEDVKKYSGGKSLYGWHISGLEIYDEPKDLCFFGRTYTDTESMIHTILMKRPPQSWGYVEELAVI